MVEIKIHKFKDMDLRGATIVDGFPTVGLVSTIAANYLIGALNLDQISALDSPDFPAVSMVYASKPKFPARIYADEKSKVAVFLSEFTPTPYLARAIAKTILEWAIEHKCKRIVIPEGLSVSKKDEKLDVYCVGSTDSARADLKKYQIKQLETGIVTGVSGVLLNEGRRANFDVISLFAEVRPDMPDARAAARVIEVIDLFIPALKIDVTPLYEEAERIEKYLRVLREHSKPAAEPTYAPQMYG
ncbi:MAG: PAC2 family protein [Candidatus Thermoplasmatota archaeon]|nr:PAC2 family protein [Candidatus Thermoplasmatota archaeon]